MTRSNRDFPWLTALGVFIGTSLVIFPRLPVVSGFPFATPFFAAYALAIALPVATLRFRANRMEWLGIRYSLAVCGAAFLGVLFTLLIDVSFLRTSSESAAGVVGFFALMGILSGWFAFGFQRWVERGRELPRRAKSVWDPRSWGAAGLVGATISILSAAALGALAVSFPEFGPTVFDAAFARIFGGVFLLVGLVGVAKEVRHRRVGLSSASVR